MVRKKVSVSKKVKTIGKMDSRLSDIVSGVDEVEKVNVMLRVDAALLNEGREVFGRRLSKIFEAALEDALRMKKDKGA